MKIEEKFCETQFGQVDYLEIGEGNKTLLYLHGWWGNPGRAIQIAHYLGGSNFKIIAPYLPCHGGSFDPPEIFSFNELVDAFADFIKKLGLKNIYAIGHSVGGAVVYELANSKGLVDKAVVIDGYDNPKHYGVVGLIPMLLKEASRKELIKTLFHHTLHRYKIKKTRPAAFEVVRLLKTFEVSKFDPTKQKIDNYMFIWGKKDVIASELGWMNSTGINTNRFINFPGGHCWCMMHLHKIWPVIYKFITT